MTLSPEAVALVSAALRHARDAEHLADGAHPHVSLDQAFHLAGFGPECARKATLSVRWLDKTIGHRFRQASEDAIDFALAIDPQAHRYEPGGWAARYPALADWSEETRYDRTGTHAVEAVQRLVAEARTAVDSVVLALWSDGRLPDGDAW